MHFSDPCSPVDMAETIACRAMHHNADLRDITCCNYSRTYRIHGIVAAWPVRTSLGANKHDWDGCLYHERKRRSSIHHGISAVGDDDSIRTVLYFLIYCPGKFYPVRRTH